MDIRQIVLDRIEKRGVSRNSVIDEVLRRADGAPNVSKRSLYDFLAGKTSLNSLALGYLLDVLGLSIK